MVRVPLGRQDPMHYLFSTNYKASAGFWRTMVGRLVTKFDQHAAPSDGAGFALAERLGWAEE